MSDLKPETNLVWSWSRNNAFSHHNASQVLKSDYVISKKQITLTEVV